MSFAFHLDWLEHLTIQTEGDSSLSRRSFVRFVSFLRTWRRRVDFRLQCPSEVRLQTLVELNSVQIERTIEETALQRSKDTVEASSSAQRMAYLSNLVVSLSLSLGYIITLINKVSSSSRFSFFVLSVSKREEKHSVVVLGKNGPSQSLCRGRSFH